MRLMFRQTILEEIRGLVNDCDRQDEVDAVALTGPEWERLEQEFLRKGLPWTEEQRLLVCGVPVRRI